ncbi:MAG: sugar-binding domain-containing protein [Deltaproteobacteria bacterium]|nr:sugar-binding domain-containing protein [Deltaproteobacteria bacterium]
MTKKWRRKKNLSEICSEALRRELEALELNRDVGNLVSSFRSHTSIEETIAARYKLTDVEIVDASGETGDLREKLGKIAADFLNRYLSDGSILGISGGRQMWCVVKNLTRRNVKVTISALGIRQDDPRILHAHANTLAGILWLLYSPRSEALVIGNDPTEVNSIWANKLPVETSAKYFVIGSCAPFNSESYLVPLLGKKAASDLLNHGACGDFLYQFFGEDGEIISTPNLAQQSILSSDLLRELSRRPDSKVILVAGGREKLKSLRFALEGGLCNVLVTDQETARGLLN